MPKRLTTRCTQTLGEGDSHEKVGEFSKQIPQVPRSCFEGVAWIVFLFQDVQILKQHITSCYILFLFSTLKGTTKAPTVDLLRLNTLEATNTEL